jgi:hypothetical protein
MGNFFEDKKKKEDHLIERIKEMEGMCVNIKKKRKEKRIDKNSFNSR